MKTSLISDLASFDALKHDWDQLAAPFNNPLLGFDWFRACAYELHSEADLNVITLTDSSGMTSGIAPMVKSRRGRKIWLEILGASTLFEPTGLLYRDIDALTLLYRMLALQQYPVLISRLWEPSEARGIVRQLPSYSGLWVKRGCMGSGVIDIKTDWTSYYGTLTAQRRYDFRRAVKRAGTLGGEQYTVVIPSIERLGHVLDTAFGIEDKSWKGERGSSILSKPTLRSFIKRYARYSAEVGQLRIFFLYLGGRPAAMAICLHAGDALWFLKIGYDESYKTCSPGMLVMMHAINYAFDQGLSRIEFLGSYEPWISIWTKNIREYSMLLHYPLNMTGIRAFSGDMLRTIKSRSRLTRKAGH